MAAAAATGGEGRERGRGRGGRGWGGGGPACTGASRVCRPLVNLSATRAATSDTCPPRWRQSRWEAAPRARACARFVSAFIFLTELAAPTRGLPPQRGGSSCCHQHGVGRAGWGRVHGCGRRGRVGRVGAGRVAGQRARARGRGCAAPSPARLAAPALSLSQPRRLPSFFSLRPPLHTPAHLHARPQHLPSTHTRAPLGGLEVVHTHTHTHTHSPDNKMASSF